MRPIALPPFGSQGEGYIVSSPSHRPAIFSNLRCPSLAFGISIATKWQKPTAAKSFLVDHQHAFRRGPPRVKFAQTPRHRSDRTLANSATIDGRYTSEFAHRPGAENLVGRRNVGHR